MADKWGRFCRYLPTGGYKTHRYRKPINVLHVFGSLQAEQDQFDVKHMITVYQEMGHCNAEVAFNEDLLYMQALCCVAADMMQEDEEAAAGPSSTAGAARSVQAGPLSAAQKTTMGLVLRDMFFKKDGGCHNVQLAQLVEEYNKKASTPASAEHIHQASLCASELSLRNGIQGRVAVTMHHTWPHSCRLCMSSLLGTSCFCTIWQSWHASQMPCRPSLTH